MSRVHQLFDIGIIAATTALYSCAAKSEPDVSRSIETSGGGSADHAGDPSLAGSEGVPLGIAGGSVAGGGSGAAGVAGSSAAGVSGDAGAPAVCPALAPWGPADVVPPAPDPNASAPDGSGFLVQAATTISFGDLDGQGFPSPVAWEQYGYDLDGLHFTDVCQAIAHCAPVLDGDAQDEVLDGDGGVDNSFGKNILPLLEDFDAMPSASVTKDFQNGVSSVLLRFAHLGAGASYADLAVDVFSARGSDEKGDTQEEPVAPTEAQWADGTYVWHPYPEILVDPTVTDPSEYHSLTSFPMSYVAQSTWLSSGDATLPLQVNLSGNLITLTIHHVRMALTLSEDHTSGAHGIIAGVLATEEFVKAVMDVQTFISNDICPTPTPSSAVLDTLRSASDINADGTQHPGESCDGISIGLGFTTKTAKLGAPAPPSTPPDTCIEGG